MGYWDTFQGIAGVPVDAVVAGLTGYGANGSQSITQDANRGINNFLTGDLDHQRSLEILGLDQDFSAQQASLDRKFNASEAEIARKFSASEAKIARDWEAQMSNTAYQRAVADMKKAGLNPYLAYSSGGASSPTSPVASAVSASTGAHGASSHSAVKASAGLGSLVGALLSGVFGVVNSAVKANKEIAIQNNKASTALQVASMPKTQETYNSKGNLISTVKRY